MQYTPHRTGRKRSMGAAQRPAHQPRRPLDRERYRDESNLQNSYDLGAAKRRRLDGRVGPHGSSSTMFRLRGIIQVYLFCLARTLIPLHSLARATVPALGLWVRVGLVTSQGAVVG